MRVSSQTYQLQWLTAIRRQQAELADVQRQVSTGKRINTAADDPAGAGQSLLLQQGLDRLQNYAANAETARRRLSLEESSLAQAGDALNRVRELAVQAANGTQTLESRNAIAAEARELLNGLLNIANAQDGEGRYLFAGNQVQTRPFVQSGGVQYVGDDGTRAQRVADARTVQEGDPGSAVFMRVPSGNGTYVVEADAGNQGTAYWSSATVSNGAAWVPGNYTLEFTAPNAYEIRSGAVVLATGSYTDGGSITFQGATIRFEGTPATGDEFTLGSSSFQDMFSTLDDFIATLTTDTQTGNGRALFQSRLNGVLQNLDQALGNVGSFRSQVGARLGTIDRQLDNNADVELELSASISALRDLDYASAISRLEQQLTSLEVAQKAYARTQSFSLFDVL
jgi:flagellar hook-associated protein 3 FlgL